MSSIDGFKEFNSTVCRMLAKTEEEINDSGVTETQLNFLLKLVFSEWEESSTATFFDLFDMESKYKLDISQVYVLFVLACSIESRQIMHYLHKFGKVTYDMMVSRGQGMLYDKLLSLTGLIFDKSTVEIQRMLQRIGIDKENSIPFTDFEIFFFDAIKVSHTDSGDVRAFLFDLDMETHSVKCFEQKKSRQQSPLLTGHLLTSSTNRCSLI